MTTANSSGVGLSGHCATPSGSEIQGCLRLTQICAKGATVRAVEYASPQHTHAWGSVGLIEQPGETRTAGVLRRCMSFCCMGVCKCASRDLNRLSWTEHMQCEGTATPALAVQAVACVQRCRFNLQLKLDLSASALSGETHGVAPYTASLRMRGASSMFLKPGRRQ